MYTPFTSRHFTTHIDPVSHIKYAVLSTRVAPIQQGFYFVNSGYSDDGRYLWFYCAFPPSAGHTLGVIDFLHDEIHHFPDTEGSGWMVDTLTGNLYWGTAEGIFMRTPNPDAKAVQIAEVPEFCKKASVSGIGSHLTFTADRKEILADIQTRAGSVIGTFSLADGSFQLWYKTPVGIPYNHAQLNPVDPDLVMVAHEVSWNVEKGDYEKPAPVNGVYPRLQLIRRDGSRKMLTPCHGFASHEWWSADGKHVYYEDGSSILRNSLDDQVREEICHIPWPDGVGVWHAFCTKDEKYFVADGCHPSHGLSWWRGCPSFVRFYNSETKKLATIVSYNPVVNGWTPEHPSIYHIDPHPRFVLDDSLITFTTTTQGTVDLAVVDVQQLLEATK